MIINILLLQIILIAVVYIVGCLKNIIVDDYHIFIPILGIFSCIKYISALFTLTRDSVTERVELDHRLECNRKLSVIIRKLFPAYSRINSICENISSREEYSIARGLYDIIDMQSTKFESTSLTQINKSFCGCVRMYRSSECNAVKNIFYNMIDVIYSVCNVDIDLTEDLLFDIRGVLDEYHNTIEKIISYEDQRAKQEKSKQVSQQHKSIVPKLKSVQEQLKSIQEDYENGIK